MRNAKTNRTLELTRQVEVECNASGMTADFSPLTVGGGHRRRVTLSQDALRSSQVATFNTPGVHFAIKNVIYKDPRTIVVFEDGTKTVVMAQNGETYDPEKGLAMALLKKIGGNTGAYYETFKRWAPEEDEDLAEIFRGKNREQRAGLLETFADGVQDYVDTINRAIGNLKAAAPEKTEEPSDD